MESGQAYCKDLLKQNPRKLILYFSELYTNCYEIWNFILFSRIYLNGNGKWKRITTPQAELGPRPRNWCTAHNALANDAHLGTVRRGHRTVATRAAARLLTVRW
jgi:hypothetical protein